ncbi:MAG: hypothetical protein WC620_00205 [Methanoregula sp.]|jgi:hypothetical protein
MSEIESDRMDGRYEGQKQILFRYSQLFFDISVEIYDVLPDESERMRNIAAIMKKGAYGIITNTTNEITPTGDECANKVTKFVQEIIE